MRESSLREDGREKWAELQGSVKGLLEETQALTRRVEGLDERLWARTSGADAERQRHRELEQQVQALEQHGRLHTVAAEEMQKRQVAKLLRVDHSIEDLAKRLGKQEEDLRALQSGPQQQQQQQNHHLEARVRQLQQQHGLIDTKVRNLQLQLSERLQVMSEAPASEDGAAEQESRMEEAVHATERGLAALEKRVMGQIKDLASALASLRVKADGQLQRVSALTERLETVNEPALETMRAELSKARAQDRREAEGGIAALRSWMQEAIDCNEEAMSEIRQALRQANAEVAARTLLPGEALAARTREERAGPCERPADAAQPGGQAPEDLEDLRRRLEWLEENGALSMAAGKVDLQKVDRVQETLTQVVEDVDSLMQRASSGEAACNALQQQLRHLEGRAEPLQQPNAVGSGSQAVAEMQVRSSEVSRRVATLEARLLEVEGGLQFMQELEDAGGHPATGLRPPVTPPPRGSPPHDRQDGRGQAVQDLQRKLEAVAGHLEVVDVLADRVAAIERHLGLPGEPPPAGGPGGEPKASHLHSVAALGRPPGTGAGRPSSPGSSTSADSM